MRTPDSLDSRSAADVAISLVDAALQLASRRQFFTRAEALGLLSRVDSAAGGVPSAARVEEIVQEVVLASGEQPLLSRTDLVNPLLDIRLELGRASRCSAEALRP